MTFKSYLNENFVFLFPVISSSIVCIFIFFGYYICKKKKVKDNQKQITESNLILNDIDSIKDDVTVQDIDISHIDILNDQMFNSEIVDNHNLDCDISFNNDISLLYILIIPYLICQVMMHYKII